MIDEQATSRFRAYACSNEQLLAAVGAINDGRPERWTLPATFSARPGDTKRHALLERDGEVIAVCSAGGDGPRLITARDDRPTPRSHELVELLSALGGPGPLVLSRDLEEEAKAANQALGGRPLIEHLPLRLYRFDKANAPPCCADPDVRPALMQDHALISRWLAAFGLETGLGEPDDAAYDAKRAIERGGVRVLEEDGEIVAIGQRGLEPAAGQVRIGLIYVPEDRRRQGYARRIVNSITAEVLAMDAIPCLFTDAANAATDELYRSLGYEPVEDLVHLDPKG